MLTLIRSIRPVVSVARWLAAAKRARDFRRPD
jgi:PhoPQ-activated pathogenicity-related protein